MYQINSSKERTKWPIFTVSKDFPVNLRYRACCRKLKVGRQHAPAFLCGFAVFTILYVSFLFSRSCPKDSSDGCEENVIFSNPSGSTVSVPRETAAVDLVFSEALLMDQSDPRLLDLIRSRYLVPPSTQPYNLKEPGKNPSENPGIIDFVLQASNHQPGFFVEAGAHDGEYLSNTLTLEKEHGWTGLLAEPDPNAFTSLRGKNRKSWLSNVCLSVSTKPEEIKFQLHKEFPVLGRMLSEDNAYDWAESVIEEINVKCFPVFSLLSALNVTTVDFFSLDIEGAELKVLRTIPFDSVNIRIFAIEHAWILEGKTALERFMKSKGYTLIRNRKNFGKMDSVFVRNI